MKLAIGSDHAGFDLKEKVKVYLTGKGHQVEDTGCHSTDSCDYADYGFAVARQVSKGEAERGIVVCGSGTGICIAANKIPGIRCGLAYSDDSARLARQHNDINVLSLGARLINHDVALHLVDLFLDTPFEGGRHAARVTKLNSFIVS